MHTAHAVAHTMQTQIQEVIQVVNVSWCPTRILTGALALLHASLPIGNGRKQRTKNDVSVTNYYLEIVNGSTHSTASWGFCPKMLLNLTKRLMFSLTLISRDHSNNKRSREKHLSFNGPERKITQSDKKSGDILNKSQNMDSIRSILQFSPFLVQSSQLSHEILCQVARIPRNVKPTLVFDICSSATIWYWYSRTMKLFGKNIVHRSKTQNKQKIENKSIIFFSLSWCSSHLLLSLSFRYLGEDEKLFVFRLLSVWRFVDAWIHCIEFNIQWFSQLICFNFKFNKSNRVVVARTHNIDKKSLDSLLRMKVNS